MEDKHRVQREFERAAPGFAARTHGRFDALDVPGFARVAAGETVLEVGVGTGNFLGLFAEIAGRLVGVDVTAGMLVEARARRPHMELIQADGSALPVTSGSVDLVTSAQTFHHLREPVPVLKEMRRVMAPDGRILIVDQVAPEHYEETLVMNELERIRDPSHAASRPPSAFRMMVRTVGLELLDERIEQSTQRMSSWMSPGEFPPDRIARVVEFIERFGDQTGMGFERVDDEWTFVRRRMMLLARRPARAAGPRPVARS